MKVNAMNHNQYIIETDTGEYFQSYNTTIAYRPIVGKVQLNRQAWNITRTTAKYRNQFLGENKAITEKKIKSGEYILVDKF